MAEPELFRVYIRRRPNENLNCTIEPNFSFSEDLIELGVKKFDLLVKIDGECFFLISITYLKYIYLVCMYLQLYPSGKDIRDKSYEQVANIFANVAPLPIMSAVAFFL